jgi:hypothetical protein
LPKWTPPAGASTLPNAAGSGMSVSRPSVSEIRSRLTAAGGNSSASQPVVKPVGMLAPQGEGSSKSDRGKGGSETPRSVETRKGPTGTSGSGSAFVPSGKSVTGESSKSGGTSKIESPKATGERLTPGELRKLISEGPGGKSSTKTSSDTSGKGAKSSGTTGKGGTIDTGKGGTTITGKGGTTITGKGGTTITGKGGTVDTGKGPAGGTTITGKKVPPMIGPDKGKLPGELFKPGTGKPGGIGKTLEDSSKKGGMRIISPGGLDVGKGLPGGVSPKVNFADRVKKGDLDKLTAGAMGKKLNLSEQYKMSLQGDVARRMGLNKQVVNVGAVRTTNNIFLSHPHYAYRGWVHPAYATYAFRSHWHLPYFYVDFCWYPRWSPWVDWCWHYHYHPLWDPRPIWCRPVVYVVATPWVYYEPPVWVALPSVPCGTWVDVAPVAVAPAQYDLQVLAVRFVDPGHPDQKLGPRYRVWFRNNSAKPVTQPFNVLLAASADGQLRPNSPQAGVRVTAVEAGDAQSVDVRLPIEVTNLGQAANTTLFAIVDDNREINDVNRANNGAKIAQTDMLPVDPAAFEVSPTSAAAGGEVIIAGEGLGPEPGKVLVHLGGIEMEAEILGWYDLGVRLSVPKLPLAGATPAELIVVRGDGAAANPVTVNITPPALDQPAAQPGAAPAPPRPQP